MKSVNRIIGITALAVALSSRADVVTDWNNVALDAIRAGRTSPPQASRQLAILHTAIYDAVNGITQTHEPYRVPGKASGGASVEAAVHAAAHSVMVNLYPSMTAMFDAAYNSATGNLPNGPAKSKGLAWGAHVAQAILADRANDGSTNTVPYAPGTNPGEWRPTISFGGVVRPPLLPQWGTVKCFGIKAGSQFRPPTPPALTTHQYADEVNQVKSLGETNSTARTADQTQIAYFWANGAGTATPPGHWNQIAQIVAEQEGNTLAENARLFALLNIAEADAAIVSWDCKYAYNYWRPITAIREADTDNNPLTIQDSTWAPLLFTPPFPEYTSGHSTFSGAAAVVLAMFYGTDDIPFTGASDDVPGAMRYYTSFSQAAEESGASRIYAGIHFWSANVHGLATGASVGEYVSEHLLRPRRERSQRGQH
ncbi:MAG: phosphatase PAP2 family protein [Verrucomicrobia subdivision 3 bacterium]|nr:phosphatase PAP2 family protein [Limisphaerales bacterium]